MKEISQNPKNKIKKRERGKGDGRSITFSMLHYHPQSKHSLQAYNPRKERKKQKLEKTKNAYSTSTTSNTIALSFSFFNCFYFHGRPNGGELIQMEGGIRSYTSMLC